MPNPADVVVISGTIGAGKTTVAEALSDLMTASRQAHTCAMEEAAPHALIDLDAVAQLHPAPVGDPYNDGLAFANLASMWPHYVARGAHRAIVARVVARAHRDRYREAFATRRVTVVRLIASSATRRQRISLREHDVQWRERFLARTDLLEAELEAAGGEDLLVSNDQRTPQESATEIAHRIGWLAAGQPPA